MKKNILYLIISSLIILASCEKNEDGYYNNVARIYFPSATDSINFSFGDQVMTYTRHIVYMPVKKLGTPATREMKYKIKLNKERSTAVEGVHFSTLLDEYSLLTDSVNAYLPVELIRDELSEEEVIYKIVFDLEESADFELGCKENLQAVITFNNYLEEPKWWKGLFGNKAVRYHPGMYQQIIAFYGHPLEDQYCTDHFLEVQSVFKREVYEYAKANPELTQDWEFQPNIRWDFN